MYDKTIKLLLIDEKAQSVEVELSLIQFKSLNIEKDKIKKNIKKSDLNRAVTEFLNKCKEDEQQ